MTGKYAQRWEKVHVFISSTFNDMHAERDYLVKRVFPELQEWCEQRKLRLVDIDLRWGVTEQDAAHHKNVLKVCLSRIDDCRPFFLCFLGQRRGWVPAASEVSAETFASFPDLKPIMGTASITEIEILHALTSPFHQSRKREPTRAAEYYEPTKYAFLYLRDSSYLDQLPNNPPTLRQIYTNEWIEDLTEREEHNQALQTWRDQKIPSLNRRLHLYEGNWDPAATTPELMIPLQCPTSEAVSVERWQKLWQKAGIDATGLNIADDPVEAPKATQFNKSLSAGRLTDFTCEAMPLSKIIINDLQAAIAERYSEHSEVKHDDELDRELDQQENFLFTTSDGFIERKDDFAELDEYVENTSNKLFVLVGLAGMGKSTLLANWVDRYRSRVERNTDHSNHFRFIGQSDGTTTVHSVLTSLLKEIKQISGKLAEEIPVDPVELREKWLSLLERTGARGKTVIVIDALNQLESGLADLRWLPRSLPKNIKLIVSFKCGEASSDALRDQLIQDDRVQLSEIKPFQNIDDRRRLVTAYLSQYLKELDEEHLETVIGLRGAENPLYLKVILSELRVFGAFASLRAQIRHGFGDNPVSAFHGVLRRLETDPAYTPLDPSAVVPLLFGFLAHARTGLTTDELIDLIMQHYPWERSSAREVSTQSPALEADRRQHVSDAVNFYLRHARPFLARRAGRSDLFYESFKIAAVERYQREPTGQHSIKRTAPQWHQPLAEMYYHQAKRQPEFIEPLYDVHVTYNIYVAMTGKYAKLLLGRLGSMLGRGKKAPVDPLQVVMQIYQIFMTILGIDIHQTQPLIDELREKGSCVVTRLPKRRAEAVVAAFLAEGIVAQLQSTVSEPSVSWQSIDARVCRELLFHQLEGGLWQRQIEVLTDDEFRSRSMELLGPKFFVDRFAELLRKLGEYADTRSFLNELRRRIPIDSEFYTPFLKQLTEGLAQDVEQATSFLADCANDPLRHGRAEMALRALSVGGEIKLNCRPERVQAQLKQSADVLLNSNDKRTRWETVHAYWSLLPHGDVEPLRRIAESETEHPLIRAEAARQLGFTDDSQVVQPLLQLANSDHYRLGWMAYRSARFIQLSQLLTEAGPVEDFPQVDKLPDDLKSVFRSIGVDPKDLHGALVNDQTRILIHIAGCSELSVDARWEESDLIDKILRLLPCRLICSEAAIGDNSLAYIREYSHSEYRLSTSVRYFHDFLLGPIDCVQLNTDYEFDVQGVEDTQIYAQGIVDKYGRIGQGVGIKSAASVARAKTILNGTLELMRKTNSKVCILTTAEIPAYQISRLMGEERQFLRQMAKDAGSLGSLGLGAYKSFFESQLPETVLELVSKPQHLLYVMLRMTEPKGDVFGMDINYIHALGIQGWDLVQKLENPPTSKPSKVIWRPQDSDFKGKDLRSLDFSCEDLQQKDFSNAMLSRSSFVEANLTRAVLEKANLRGADLTNSVLAFASCARANFFQTQLSKTDLNHADLRETNFYEARLTNARLRNSRLDNSILYAASLQNSDLTNAGLRGADLRRAKLAGADLRGANLEGARFDLTQYDEKTLWPEGFAVDALRSSGALRMIERDESQQPQSASKFTVPAAVENFTKS